jgi:D-alanyl-lipoteichoic acid acyltransferase DltB (MBOAT superfamily)
MLFNSIEFLLFLPIVLLFYWFGTKRNIKVQNILLLVASYFFYAWWDWRFLSLIVFSSAVDFSVGIALGKTTLERKRKWLLGVSILVNIGFLGFFKYFNFFADGFAQAFTLMGMSIEADRLNIVLPVGISFYTFQTLSYTIDVYRKKFEPTKDVIAFFAFVSFFPQLVAGPIERARNLLPQFTRRRSITYEQSADGFRQILWGFFKKIVIADNCAGIVNDIFSNYSDYNGSTLVLGAVLFAFQIFGDFSGYSDIAIGTARLFGFNLMRNFAFPYFSRDIAEFWRRWHISLSTWFRDYVYIPLGGSRGSVGNKIRNILIIFIVSGFWHGANWTFIAWGALNALYFIPLMLVNRNRKHTNQVAEHRALPGIWELLQMLFTFGLTTLAWVFFRAENLSHALSYLQGIFSKTLFTAPDFIPWLELIMILVLISVEWIQRKKQHGLEFGVSLGRYKALRWTVYCVLLLMIYFLGEYSSEYEFIYFQF